jgi:hypothetical protein
VDSNLEGVMDRDTALDHMVVEIEFSELKTEQCEIIRLLTKLGQGPGEKNDAWSIIVGECGEGIGCHKQV